MRGGQHLVVVHGFIEQKQHGCCRWLDYRSVRMRPGEHAYGVHGIPQRLHHELDFIAVRACKQEEPSDSNGRIRPLSVHFEGVGDGGITVSRRSA